MQAGSGTLCLRILLFYVVIIVAAIAGREYVVRSIKKKKNQSDCQYDLFKGVSQISSAYNPFLSRCEWNRASELTSSDVHLKYNSSLTFDGRFVSLHKDTETDQWINLMLRSQRTVFMTWLSNTISKISGSNQYVSKALLGSPQVYLMSKDQWKFFLSSVLQQRSTKLPFNRILDIGASNGDVSARLQALSYEIWLTDVSSLISWCHWYNGFTNSFVATSIDQSTLLQAGAPTEYEAIFFLNVLDQLSDPVTYLQTLVGYLQSQNEPLTLIISVPLPWTKKKRSKFSLPGETWEEATANLHHVFDTVGLQTLGITRAPYLCQGTYQVPLFSLDTAIFALGLKPSDSEVNE